MGEKPKIHTSTERDGMDKTERSFLNIAMKAGRFSHHWAFLDDQLRLDWSDHFTQNWRNALGNPNEGSLKAIHFVWRRWEEHKLRCTDYHDGRSILEVVFTPTIAQHAHYLGERSQNGKTTATEKNFQWSSASLNHWHHLGKTKRYRCVNLDENNRYLDL